MNVAITTPARFEPVDDFPLMEAAPDCPYRNETFNLWGYDQTEQLGLNVHLVAGGGDLSSYQATVILYAGETILAGQFRGGVLPDGVAAGNVFARNVEPFKRWKYDFLGLLHRTDPKSSAQTPFADMPTEMAAFDLDVEMRSPAVEQGTQGDDGVQAASGTIPRTARRYEQLCRIAGTVRLGSRRVTLNALGMRVHRRNSAGIFDSGVVGHSWITGLFPSGRGFHICIYQKEPAAAVGFCHAFYFDGVRHHEAKVLRFPYYSGLTEPETYELELAAAGETFRIRGLPVAPYMKGFPSPAMKDVLFSRAPGRFMLDSEVGGGVLERSLRADFFASGRFEAPGTGV